ncbi:MAG: hypothetical protein Q7S48_03500, partial [bacterium]|nr:hypothetical protein [bacterium]
ATVANAVMVYHVTHGTDYWAPLREICHLAQVCAKDKITILHYFSRCHALDDIVRGNNLHYKRANWLFLVYTQGRRA